MKKELISVIVPVYNVEKYLQKCVDSIINQTYNEMEIILVDDGSTDSSGKICDQYKNKDERIIVIHKKNGGLSSARNSGLDIMKGKYVYFVDSDDFVHKEMLENMYEVINNNQFDIVCCNGRDYSDFENNFELETDVFNKDKIEVYSKNEALLKCNTTLFIVAYQKLYNSKIFKKLRFKEGIIHEDTQIAPYIYNSIDKVAVIPNIYYYRYIRHDSIVHSNFSQKNYDVIKVAEDRVQFYESHKLDFLYDQGYSFLLGTYVILYKKAKECRVSTQILKDIIKQYKIIYKKYSNKISMRNKIKYGLFFVLPNLCIIILNISDWK